MRQEGYHITLLAVKELVRIIRPIGVTDDDEVE